MIFMSKQWYKRINNNITKLLEFEWINLDYIWIFYGLYKFYNYFYTQYQFLNLFFLFSLIPGLGALIQRRSGFNSQNNPDTGYSRGDGGLVSWKQRVSFIKCKRWRGIGPRQPPDRNLAAQIRSPITWTGTQHRPLDQ